MANLTNAANANQSLPSNAIDAIDAIGQAYLDSRPSPVSKKVQAELSNYINRQFDALIESGVEVVFTPIPDCYSGYEDIQQSLEAGYLYVFDGANESFLSPIDNIKFRAIHDVAHVEAQAGFSPSEELATLKQQLREAEGLSVEAKKVLYSDVVGQAAAWQKLGGVFAVQKFVANLPYADLVCA